MRASVTRSISHSIAFSRLVPAVCSLSIRINWITAGVAIAVGAWLIQPIIFACGVLAVRLIRAVNRSAPSVEDIPQRRAALFPIDDQLPSADAVELDRLCSKAGLERNSLTFLTDLNSSQLTPAVRRNVSHGHDVIIPASFFAQWQQEPAVAYAVLSHEIGHILQKDVDLGVTVRRYTRYMLRRVFLIELLSIVAAALAVTYFAPETARQLEQENWSFLTWGTAWEAVAAQHNLARGVSLLAIVSAVVAALSFLLFLFVITITPIYAIRSETVCDRVASYLTGDAAIRRALEWISSKSSTRRSRLLFRIRLQALSSMRDSDRGSVWPSRWIVVRFAVFLLAGVVGTHSLPFAEKPNYWELAEVENNFWPLWEYNRPAAEISPDGNWIVSYDPWSAAVEIVPAKGGSTPRSFSPVNQSTMKGMAFEFDSSSRVLFVWTEWGVEAVSIESGINLGQLSLGSESSGVFGSMINMFRVSTQNSDDTIVAGLADGQVVLMSFELYSDRIALNEISRIGLNGDVRDVELLEAGHAYAVLVDLDDTPNDRIAWVGLVDGQDVKFQAQLPPIRGIADIAVSSDQRWIAFSGMGAVGVIAVPSGIPSMIEYFGLNAINNTPSPVEFVPGTDNLIAKADFGSPFDSTRAVYVPVRKSDGSINWQKDHDIQDAPARLTASNSGDTRTSATEYSERTHSRDTLAQEDERIRAISTSPSGQHLASLHADGIVRVWQVDYAEFGSGSLVTTFPIGKVRCISLVNDDELAWEGEDGHGKRHVISTSSEMIAPSPPCRASDPLGPFAFSDRVFTDSSNGVEVDINQPLDNELKEVRKISESDGAAEYLINHTDGDQLGIWRISVKRHRYVWSVGTFWGLVASAFLAAELAIFMRRLRRRNEDSRAYSG